MIARSDFHFDLPRALIAQHPLARRSASRLLVLAGDAVRHCRFDAVVDVLAAEDLLVVNDTRVVKARLEARKDSGGRAEILVERIQAERLALCQVRVSKPLQVGRSLSVDACPIRVVERAERRGEFCLLEFPMPVAEFLERHGQVPLPPYIDRAADATDEERYQTVYAAAPGAVAAPTAGLHFDAPLLARLAARGVAVARITLHVGAGTFQPVRTEDLRQHRLHAERYVIPPATRQALADTAGQRQKRQSGGGWHDGGAGS